MGYISIPNLPEQPVELVIIDGRTSIEIEESLCKIGIRAIRTKEYKGLYTSIAYHPDIMIHHIGGERIVYAPGTNEEFLNELLGFGFKLIKGSKALKSKYPGNIAFNVARIGNYAIHNLKYTDEILKKELERMDVEFIHVSQGYAKCSVSVVNSNCIITADKGIAKAAGGKQIEVLQIAPEKSILLPGLSNGFIGGSTGLLGKEKWAITGDVRSLDSYIQIVNFLNNKGIEVLSLSEESVIDVGSIIPILTK